MTLDLALDIFDRQPCGVVGGFRRGAADQVSAEMAQPHPHARLDLSLVRVPVKDEHRDRIWA
jgi:hypothetical protein